MPADLDSLHISSSQIREGIPAFNRELVCKEHPEADVHENYGMSGGGFGPYTVCDFCGTVISKSQEED